MKKRISTYLFNWKRDVYAKIEKQIAHTGLSKDKKEVDWDDWEKRFQALTAPIRGFYGVSYDEETKMFKEYIAPTDLTVKTLTWFDLRFKIYFNICLCP